MKFRITANVFLGGGTLSHHRTITGLERAMDRYYRIAKKQGGYADITARELIEGEWRTILVVDGKIIRD